MSRFRTLLRFAAPVMLGGTMMLAASAGAQAACHLRSGGDQIKHVVYITFDNVHLRRDNPNVPSDLEQMPNLLNFIQSNGFISGNHHTPLISHTATDILTALTGVYGDRMGIPVSNSYGFFRTDGSVGFSSSFLYWTALAGDGKPQMINENGKTAPAPWVPFTRAGCDVGAFSVANIEFERLPDDVTTFFGAGSPEDVAVRAELASSDPATRQQPNTDYLGIAVHCAKNSPLCNNSFAKNDLLPDEPDGYTGFKGLFGNINVQPVISSGGPVKDLDGNVIADSFGHPGFPNLFNPTATQSLGYAATMLEAGIPVIYVYVSDAHDNRSGPGTFGPGEAGYVAQLQQYDAAFGKFFARLAAHGVTKQNTLFVIVPDENDHFVGGTPTPANCDGVTVPCSYAAGQKGEITAVLNRLLITQRGNATVFSVHNDDAPTIYINGNPAPTDAVTRTLEHDVDALTATNPITGQTDRLSQLLADQAEMKLLHMVTASPARTPTFTMFANDNYFFQNGSATPCAQPSDCIFVNPSFAWNHGDYQEDITRTWVAMAGPGVRHLGRNDQVFSDHTDVRPTMLALLGLKDSYVHDGRVLVEMLNSNALPGSLAWHQAQYVALATFYKQLNAPVGAVGMNSLALATQAITGNDSDYQRYLAAIGPFTTARDALASEIKTALDDAAFSSHGADVGRFDDMGHHAGRMVEQVRNSVKGHDRHW